MEEIGWSKLVRNGLKTLVQEGLQMEEKDWTMYFEFGLMWLAHLAWIMAMSKMNRQELFLPIIKDHDGPPKGGKQED